MKIQIGVDENNHVTGWGTSLSMNNRIINIEIDEENNFFKNPFAYKLMNKKLIYDYKKDLDDTKKYKLQELNQSCNTDILSGFDFMFKDTSYHISYDKEAQDNLSETKQLFDIGMIETITWTFHNGEASERIVLNKTEFGQLYFTSVMAKNAKISMLKDGAEPYINSLTEVSHVQNVHWKNWKEQYELKDSLNK